MRSLCVIILTLILVGGCTGGGEFPQEKEPVDHPDVATVTPAGGGEEVPVETEPVNHSALETATLAGGCFWCMEALFQETKGVADVVSGYTGGHVENPTYAMVSSGTTGHYEAVQVFFDPQVISYDEILAIYWRYIDPTDGGGQFVDRGDQYRTAIFYHDEEQKRLAEESRAALEASGQLDGPVVTEILPFDRFYLAEEYHQDYYLKKRDQYERYKKGSGREDRLRELWDYLT